MNCTFKSSLLTVALLFLSISLIEVCSTAQITPGAGSLAGGPVTPAGTSGNPIPQSGGGTGSAGPYTALHLIGQNAAGTSFADTGISYTAGGNQMALAGGTNVQDDATGQGAFSSANGKALNIAASGTGVFIKVNGTNELTLTTAGFNASQQAVFMGPATASSPGIFYTGTWFVGGTTTTNFPQLLLQPTGTTAGSWNASGTALGTNAPSGFSGDLINLEIAGVSKFRVDGTGDIVTAFLTSNTGGLIVSGSVSSSLPMKPGGLTRTTTGFTATSNTVLANVTALTATVAAGQSYKFHAWLPTTATTAGGVQFAISGTATATNIIYEGVLTATATGFLSDTRVASLGSVVGSSATATSATCVIDGTIVVNAGGTLTVQFAQNTTNASASTVLQGANFEVTQTSN